MNQVHDIPLVVIRAAPVPPAPLAMIITNRERWFLLLPEGRTKGYPSSGLAPRNKAETVFDEDGEVDLLNAFLIAVRKMVSRPPPFEGSGNAQL